MPSLSRSQQRLMGQAYALKKGILDPSKISKKYLPRIEKIANSISLKRLKKFASTKHTDLPERVGESIVTSFYDFSRKRFS
jgi:hypothetical protein